MTKQAGVKRSAYALLPTDADGVDSLAQLALDMRWSWNHATDKTWRQLEPDVWETTHKPWVVACAAYHSRADDKGAIGRKIVGWQRSLDQKWATLHFGEVTLVTQGEQHFFEVEVFLGGLDPEAVRVELSRRWCRRQRFRGAGDEASGSSAELDGQLHLPRGGVRGAPRTALYGAFDPALRRRCGPARRRANPVAALTRIPSCKR